MASINDYFSFSKRERSGVVAFIVLILLVFIIPEFISSPNTSIDANAFAETSKQIAALKMNEDEPPGSISEKGMQGNDIAYNESSKERYPPESLVFEFDPNTLSEDGWKKLGVSDRTIKTIQKYISKGGRFRNPEDIERIYGLRKEQYQRLLPFVRIKVTDLEKKRNDDVYSKPSYSKTDHHAPSILDINTADTSLLIALPGIGSKLANRIILFRDKLGGFHSIEQIKEIYGLPDSTFQKIKPFMQCNPGGIQQININTIDVIALKSHPYIKWNIANAIINYRQQHGNYKEVDDLLKIDIISSDVLQKMMPYIRVHSE